MTTSKTSTLSPRKRGVAIAADKAIYHLSRHWMLVFSIVYGLYVSLPFLAPVFMQLGWENAGKATYLGYSFLCHQLPQRSYFMFGERITFSLAEIQGVWQNSINPLVLRQFIGNSDMGWKVAWSDRMVSMYTSILLFAWIWYPLRNRVKPLPWWGFILLLLPMGIDGITHTVSDLYGIGQGFRDSNTWLETLTNGLYPASFYSGDALGSFNSWMRLITGAIFGLGIVWFGFPFVDEAISSTVRLLESTFQREELEL